MMIDISPATDRMARLLAGVSDDQIALPTPCPKSRVGDLIDHIGTFAKAFTAVAQKNKRGTDAPPPPNADNLEAGWRDRIARDLATLADAWREPTAWEGMTSAGGMDVPGQVGGVIALDELVVHGWDLAVSTGQPYDPPVGEIDAASSFVASFDAPRDGNLFGPVVPVADDAAPLDKLLGLTGRDPGWRPPS
jgi:uncharacterized protein (TIGR03086 family)